MAQRNSSTTFKLLCGAIGLLAIGLLVMVGFMVYPYLFGGDTPASVKAPNKSKRPRAPEPHVGQSAVVMSDHLWPAKKAEINTDPMANPIERFNFAGANWRLIGTIIPEGGGGGYLIMQREDTRAQMLLPLNSEARNEMQAMLVSPDKAQIKFGSQVVALKVQQSISVMGLGGRMAGVPTNIPMVGTTMPTGTFMGAPPTPAPATASPASAPAYGTGRQYWQDRPRGGASAPAVPGSTTPAVTPAGTASAGSVAPGVPPPATPTPATMSRGRGRNRGGN